MQEIMTNNGKAQRYHGISGKEHIFMSSECVRLTRKYMRLLGFLAIYREIMRLKNESGDKGGSSNS